MSKLNYPSSQIPRDYNPWYMYIMTIPNENVQPILLPKTRNIQESEEAIYKVQIPWRSD